MVSKGPNLSVRCDYATPDKVTHVELRMALSIPYEDLSLFQTWLDTSDWISAEHYLAARHPQHAELVAYWIAISRARSETPIVRLTAAA